MKITIISPEIYTYGSMVIGGVLRDAGFDVKLTRRLNADTDTILLSLYSTLHLLDDRIRDFVSQSDKTIYVGGPVSAYPEIVLGELDVDAVIIGEGEESTVELLNSGISE
ncbi:MAG TPA: B12-binding domain-containing radical SAM protein, partial [Methanosarcinales archaeon]|nr:B12-binding domain-containing radical SAM protein [Methanosarcinales archaeon]